MDTLQAMSYGSTTYMVCRIESGWWFTQPEDAEEEEEIELVEEEILNVGDDEDGEVENLLAKRLRDVAGV